MIILPVWFIISILIYVVEAECFYFELKKSGVPIEHSLLSIPWYSGVKYQSWLNGGGKQIESLTKNWFKIRLLIHVNLYLSIIALFVFMVTL